MPKTYILADVKRDWINEVSNTLLLEEYPITIIPVRSIDLLYKTASDNPDKTIIVSSDLAQDERFNVADYTGHTITGFARNIGEAEALKQNGIGCIGITKHVDKFLEVLSLPELPSMYPVEPQKAKTVAPDATGFSKQKADPQPVYEPKVPEQQPQQAQPIQKVQQVQQVQQIPQVQQPVQAQPVIPQAAPAEPTQPAPQMQQMFSQFTPEQIQMMQVMMTQMMQGQTPQQPLTTPSGAQPNTQGMTGGEIMMEMAVNRQNQEADLEIDRDMRALKSDVPSKATITTVYAAKGGVGKTTIATETAVFLALTNNGRRRLNVCVVDYNIDFGDVCSHLELDPRGNNMTTWAAEIQEMLDSGTAPEEINFTKNEILSNYLQKMEQTGLYALIAPINHEDSMGISANALKVMLRNIAENCGFDFVVVDTGNNTRDAAVIALDMADNILMIATQDITTANCDSAVLKVMRKTGLNTDKVRLVINNVIPAREAGISVNEVAETFHFECVAQIRRTSDIIKANNFGKPLVYKENHEFTRQIQNIVRFLTSGILPDEFDQPRPKKKKRFGLFGKK